MRYPAKINLKKKAHQINQNKKQARQDKVSYNKFMYQYNKNK